MAILARAIEAKMQDSCKALVLSGGGNNGSWEIGVLYGMIMNGDPTDFEFDVITGISAGAINTGGLVGWPKGKEVEMVEFMSEKWHSLKTDDVWQDWPLGKVSGALLMEGAVDDAPLLAFLQSIISEFP